MGVGAPEVLVILLVALLVFGPKSLPDVARTLAKGMRELRRLSTEFQRELNMMDLEGEAQAPATKRVAESTTPALPTAPPAGTVQQPGSQQLGAQQLGAQQPGAQQPGALPGPAHETAAVPEIAQETGVVHNTGITQETKGEAPPTVS